MTRYILTHSGRVVDIVNPDPSTLVIEDVAHALARINRYTGHSDDPISVAQHAVLVSTLVPPEAAAWGLLHDASEAYLGDWSTPVKAELIARAPSVRTWLVEWDRAIASAFGVTRRRIKASDVAACIAERRDNGPRGLDDRAWFEGAGKPPPNVPLEAAPGRVVPWSTELSQWRFLQRWDEVRP